jgi:hypothetical protein
LLKSKREEELSVEHSKENNILKDSPMPSLLLDKKPSHPTGTPADPLKLSVNDLIVCTHLIFFIATFHSLSHVPQNLLIFLTLIDQIHQKINK